MRERFVGKEEDLHESNDIDSIFIFSTTTNPSEYVVINITSMNHVIERELNCEKTREKQNKISDEGGFIVLRYTWIKIDKTTIIG